MRRGILIAVVLAVCGAGWFLFWPAELGGHTSYVTTHGTSMEPRFHTGDLALIRPTDHYAVGDVVAYHSSLLHTVVMHRIVATDNGNYTFKGDNNSWLDPEHPTKTDLVGKLALRVPEGGTWLGRVTSPPILGLAAFALLATGATKTRTRRRTQRRRAAMSRHITTRTGPFAQAKNLPSRLIVAAGAVLILGLAGVALGVLSWTGPANQPAIAGPSGTARMTFSYTAAVAKTAAYDSITVTSPDPIFRKLANEVEVHYAYEGEPGTITVNAELSTASGWHSTVPLAAPTTFTQDRYDGTVPLNLPALDARAQAAAAATGIPAGAVSIAVQARVRNPTGEDFLPALKMSLSPQQLTLTGNPKNLTFDKTTTAPAVAIAPRTLTLGSWSITAATGRITSSVLLLLAFLGGAVLIRFGRRTAADNESALIHRRYASLLVRVHPMPTPPGRMVIDVTSFATLARLAQRYGLLVLHWTRTGIKTFIVQDENTTYRYRTGERSNDPEMAPTGHLDNAGTSSRNKIVEMSGHPTR